jgi:phosphoribosylanthranilate isomerase
MARVKICGLKTPEIVDATVDAGAEMIGLNFFPKSPRYVAVDDARGLSARIKARGRGETAVVALVVDPDDALVRAVVETVEPDFLQLHGHETPERVAEIGRLGGTPIIKALPVATAEDALVAETYAGKIWIALFDAKPPKGALLTGGNGLAFDWTVLRAARDRSPFMLSGGLTPDNVRDAIRIADPLYVDVSSGVETAPGVKDAALIRAFIAASKAPV